MVFERLIAPSKLERHPLEIFLIGVFYCNVAIITALTIFRRQASIISVLFTVILCLPLVYYLMTHEEKSLLLFTKELNILKSHSRTAMELMVLFLAFVLTFTGWYVMGPENIVNSLFNTQHETISNIHQSVTGNFGATATMKLIFNHNVKIFIVSTLLSFFFGTGAIFILAWNASVLSAAMGAKFLDLMGKNAGDLVLNPLGYFVHAVPEILAYVLGGVLGGMISVAIINKDLSIADIGKAGRDSLVLISLAIIILFIAAWLEVFVSPGLINP